MVQINTCQKCRGTKLYMYDEHHVQACDVCCSHTDGWQKLEKRYGNNNGKYMCRRGCGTIVDELPDDEETLMNLTRDALADILGREPTRQEVLRAHAGFKRMAFHMYEHLRHEEKSNITPQESQED